MSNRPARSDLRNYGLFPESFPVCPDESSGRKQFCRPSACDAKSIGLAKSCSASLLAHPTYQRVSHITSPSAFRAIWVFR
jgi:hypothetical protein